MLEGKRIHVIVPARNEAAHIGAMLEALPSFVDAVVVVDDASTDDTGATARAARSDVVVERHEINRGVGAALVTGYRRALSEGADVVVVMAGDGQMDAADLARIALPVVRGRAAYAKGDRMAHPDVLGSMPFHRYAFGRALAALTRRAANLERLSDSQSGYTAISREALERIDLDRLYPRYGYPNDLIGALALEGLAIEDVVIRPVYRREKSGLRPWHLATISALIARVYARRVARDLSRRSCA